MAESNTDILSADIIPLSSSPIRTNLLRINANRIEFNTPPAESTAPPAESTAPPAESTAPPSEIIKQNTTTAISNNMINDIGDTFARPSSLITRINKEVSNQNKRNRDLSPNSRDSYGQMERELYFRDLYRRECADIGIRRGRDRYDRRRDDSRERDRYDRRRDDSKERDRYDRRRDDSRERERRDRRRDRCRNDSRERERRDDSRERERRDRRRNNSRERERRDRRRDDSRERERRARKQKKRQMGPDDDGRKIRKLDNYHLHTIFNSNKLLSEYKEEYSKFKNEYQLSIGICELLYGIDNNIEVSYIRMDISSDKHLELGKSIYPTITDVPIITEYTGARLNADEQISETIGDKEYIFSSIATWSGVYSGKLYSASIARMRIALYTNVYLYYKLPFVPRKRYPIYNGSFFENGNDYATLVFNQYTHMPQLCVFKHNEAAVDIAYRKCEKIASLLNEQLINKNYIIADSSQNHAAFLVYPYKHAIARYGIGVIHIEHRRMYYFKLPFNATRLVYIKNKIKWQGDTVLYTNEISSLLAFLCSDKLIRQYYSTKADLLEDCLYESRSGKPSSPIIWYDIE